MPRVDILFSQLKKWTINSVFVQGIMQQFTQFFWLQRTLFHTRNSRPPNYEGTTSSAEGVAWTIPDGSMPWGAWTARARSTLLAALIFRARAGNLQGPYCISNNSLLLLGPEQVDLLVDWTSISTPWTLCLSRKGDIIQCFETIRGVWAYHSAGSWRICEATGGWYFQLLPETISIMPCLGNLFSQLQKWTIDSVFVWGIMQQFTQVFWL